ncbi:MAG: alpha-2-macroglobulin family protein [Vicinamibacterales bacterium]
MSARQLLVVVIALTIALAWPGSVAAQDAEESQPAFILSSGETFTSRDRPSFNLTFQNLRQLDFRVYRVRDAAKFFAGLSDPHQLGSREPFVPSEPTWLERVTSWKRDQRTALRRFLRSQVSEPYLEQRRAQSDSTEVTQRVTLNQATFAQVPLLNPSQLVTSWRELLPHRRDAEMRRVPLDVREPGVYVVEAVTGTLRAYTLVVVADVGLVTKVAPGQMLIFAADRLTGEPRAGCTVQVLADRAVASEGLTDADGVVTASLPGVRSDTLVTLARCGDQVAVTDPRGYSLSSAARELLGYVYSDKPIYRPGHTVHIRTVLRWRERDALTPFDRPNAEITATDVDDKVVFRRAVPVDEFGVGNASFVVPDAAALGNYTVRVTSGGQQALGSFEVQEYRRPEFEVSVTPASRFVVQGQTIVATVEARYYFGQPVAGGRVRYVVGRQSYFSPFRYTDEFEGDGEPGYYGGEQDIIGELRLDAQGRGEIRVPTELASTEQDLTFHIEAQVTDASGREISGATNAIATYGSFLTSTQVDGYVFRAGQTVTASFRAVDYLGVDKPGVALRVFLERLTYPNGYYGAPTVTLVRETRVVLDAMGRGSAQVALGTEPGDYRIRATTTVSGRTITSQAGLWVPGRQSIAETDGDRYLELLSDKKTYAPGDMARLSLRGEQVTGPVLVSKEGQQITWHRVVRVSADTPLEVPIEPGDVGDVFVNLAYMRDGRLYRAERKLTVPAQQRTLQISLTADKAVAKPQEPGIFTVKVTNALGEPVRAQLSLGVIDEAVYALAADTTPDPVRFFYRREYSRVSTTFSREYYFVGYAGSSRLQLAGRSRRPFSLADFKGDKEPQAQVRKDFPDAIYWIGNLVTGSDGTAKVSIKYPDTLTTWRLTARAITVDTMAGTTVARTTTTKDLIVRVITPRFLTQGDEVVLPTIVHNYLPDQKDATVSVDTKNLQAVPGTPTAPVTTAVASGGERRDNWRFSAGTVGTASITASARTSSDTDAVELPIPVLPLGLRREAGNSGSLVGAGEATTQVTIPATANPAARSVRVSLAPSLAGSMLGALDFLTSYPYGCTEQTLSSFLPNLVVTRALGQLKIVPAERMSVLDRQVNDGLKRLLDFQNDDGGWGWWRSEASQPFMTAYAVYGLTEARREGVRFDAYRLERGARELASLYARYPRAVPDLKAYVVFVLGRTGVQIETYRHADALNDLWGARDRMSSYGRALLLLALDDAKDARGSELATRLLGEATTQGELSFWKSDSDPLLGDFGDTGVEATATAVRALARRDPRNPVLDRAVRWLMLNRSGGDWGSTKQTAMALYGLLDLLTARNETPEPFTADIFVNGALAGSWGQTGVRLGSDQGQTGVRPGSDQGQTPQGGLLSPDPQVLTVAAREGANDVRIVKRGGGTLYWSATSVYFDPQAAEGRSGSRQLAISRAYARLTAVRQPNGTFLYREQPLAGQIRPGDVLAVRLTVAGSTDWRYLALEDPLPAGVEAIQDTTAYPLENGSRDWWWYGPRVEYRDSKTTFFLESFEQGRYEFVYLVKATSSGEFKAIPAQISPMYVPGVNASTEPAALSIALPAEAAR